jgi:hypothetical protein
MDKEECGIHTNAVFIVHNKDAYEHYICLPYSALAEKVLQDGEATLRA